jgi:hypothetical protein
VNSPFIVLDGLPYCSFMCGDGRSSYTAHFDIYLSGCSDEVLQAISDATGGTVVNGDEEGIRVVGVIIHGGRRCLQ